MENVRNEDEESTVIDLSKPPQEDPGGGGDEPDTRTNDRAQDPELEEPEIEPRASRLEFSDAELETAEEREGGRRRGEDDEDYGRRVRARINRERALRERSDERVNEVEASNVELRERIARIERKQNTDATVGETTKKLSELKKEIDELKAKAIAAQEAGETKTHMDLVILIGEKTGKIQVLEGRLEDQRAAIARQDEDQHGREGDPDGQGKKPDTTPRNIRKWQMENRKWFNLRKFADARADAITLDNEILSEMDDGQLAFERYSPEHLAELSNRLKKLYPELDVRDSEGEPVETEPEELETRTTRTREQPRERDQRRPAGGNMGTRDGRRGGGSERDLASKGRVKLTDADYATMRTFGLDPKNEKDLRGFAKERLRTIMSEGRTGRGGRS